MKLEYDVKHLIRICSDAITYLEKQQVLLVQKMANREILLDSEVSKLKAQKTLWQYLMWDNYRYTQLAKRNLGYGKWKYCHYTTDKYFQYDNLDKDLELLNFSINRWKQRLCMFKQTISDTVWMTSKEYSIYAEMSIKTIG